MGSVRILIAVRTLKVPIVVNVIKYSHFFLLVSHKCPQYTDFGIGIGFVVEIELISKLDLVSIILQGLLADSYHIRSLGISQQFIA